MAFRKARKQPAGEEKERVVMMKLDKENKLTNDELEQVAGGGGWADDSRFLNVLLRGRKVQCGRYGGWTVDNHSEEIEKAWRSVGVIILHDVHGYGYSLDYKTEISQAEAWLHAEQVVGKHLKRADWDW